MITSFQVEKTFPGGQFIAAWDRICMHFEKRNKKKVMSYEDKYYTFTFEDDFFPGSAILKFDQKHKDMNQHIDEARAVDEKQFIQHVLAKLPQGKEGERGC